MKPYKTIDPKNHLNWTLRDDMPELFQHHIQRSKTDTRYLNSFRNQTDIINYLREDKESTTQYGKKYWKQNDWCLYRLQMVFEKNQEQVDFCDNVFNFETYYIEESDIYTEEHMDNAWEKVEPGYIKRKKERVEHTRIEIEECRKTGVLYPWLSPDEVWTKKELMQMENETEIREIKTRILKTSQLELF